ncbi:MAG: hypothetical protein AAF317_19645, partial [Pseudomonadota bacterium]
MPSKERDGDGDCHTGAREERAERRIVSAGAQRCSDQSDLVATDPGDTRRGKPMHLSTGRAGFMLRAAPGVFCAGEMLDWEA